METDELFSGEAATLGISIIILHLLCELPEGFEAVLPVIPAAILEERLPSWSWGH